MRWQLIRHTWNRKTIRELRVGQRTIVRRRGYRLDGKQTTKGSEGSALLPVDRVAARRDGVTGIINILLDARDSPAVDSSTDMVLWR
jgi:hypothetical protein